MSRVAMTGLSYALGERVRGYKEAQNLAATLAKHRIPDLPELMGFGQYRESSTDIFTLAIQSAQQSLARAGSSGADVDLVLFCSTNFSLIDGDGRERTHRLCKGLGLTRAFPMGITLNNCTSFLSAIKMAEALVRGGSHRNVLVVTSDKVYDESQRCIHYGIFSDSAASCLVSGVLTHGFELLATAYRADCALIADGGLDDGELYARVQDNLLTAGSCRLADVAKTFTSNIFTPIVRAKEMRLGYADEQLYLNNVAQKAHCFAADALINLTDYCATDGCADGATYTLSADADGLRVSLLVRALPAK